MGFTKNSRASHVCTEAVHEWNYLTDQNFDLGITRPAVKFLTPFSPPGLARDWSYYTPPLLYKGKSLQDNARSETQKPAWLEIYPQWHKQGRGGKMYQLMPGAEENIKTIHVQCRQHPQEKCLWNIYEELRYTSIIFRPVCRTEEQIEKKTQNYKKQRPSALKHPRIGQWRHVPVENSCAKRSLPQLVNAYRSISSLVQHGTASWRAFPLRPQKLYGPSTQNYSSYVSNSTGYSHKKLAEMEELARKEVKTLLAQE